MKSPIKLNNSNLPKFLLNFLPNEEDPRNLAEGSSLSSKEFSKCIESIYFGGKFSKTTMPERHILSDQAILRLLNENHLMSILDVGASDGSTSLDLLNKLNGKFIKYYVTDINFSLHVIEKNKNSYFYDPLTKECIMIVNNKFIIYHDNISLFPIGLIAKFLIKKSPSYDFKLVKEIKLCQPELQKMANNDQRIEIVEWSVFEKWQKEKVDIIKVANVLKPNVFSDREIIQALKNLKSILKPNGYIMIIKNEACEKYSLFQYDGNSFKLISKKNEGCDITGMLSLA